MQRRTLVLGALALAASVLFMLGVTGPASGTVSGTNVLYTLDADFDQGTLVNVNHDAPNNNQLQLNTTSGAFPFIWVALSRRCTITKINTETGAILGEYRTISDSTGCSESSRTTVGLDGSVWVGHRGFSGHVTHVGLVELNQCVDRNGNGTIETSGAYGDVKAWPGNNAPVSAAADECILHHINTGGGDSRHMSIDPDGNLWVGDRNNGGVFRKYDTATGTLLSGPHDWNCGGYGGLIDGNGVIWSASSGGSVLRWDPDAATVNANTNLPGANPRCIPIDNYGMAIDANGFVWTTELFGSSVHKISPDGNTIQSFSKGAGSPSSAQGLAIDGNGDVWISSSLFCAGAGCPVTHLKNNGTFVGNVPNPTGGGSTGVSVDAAGKIWTANINANTATRIDPTLGGLGADGVTPVGAVDLTVNFPATAGPPARPLPFPYNYSDMTGAQLLGTSPQGTWTVTQDGTALGTEWGTITWNTEPQGTVPAGATLTVEARAADTEAGLGSQAYVAVTNGTAFSLTGRFIQVRVTFKPNDAGDSPILSDIRIQADVSASADLSVTKSDAPDPVEAGQPLTYMVRVDNAGPDAAADVTVTDTLPGTVTFVSASASQGTGCTHASPTVTCNLGTIDSGAFATVTINVTPTTQGTITNSVTVSSATTDPVSTNNTDTEDTTVDPAVPRCNGLVATFVGGDGDDYIQTGPGDDVIVDSGGDNYIQTNGGDDHICLGDGNDEVDSGDGDDFVDAGDGKNKIKTGNGSDTVRSGTGDDDIDTGDGDDIVMDTGGKNKIFTGNGSDRVNSGSGDDEIETGNGDDVVLDSGGNNTVKTGDGDDHITTGDGDDKIDGGNGFDTCSPGGGSNELKDCEA